MLYCAHHDPRKWFRAQEALAHVGRDGPRASVQAVLSAARAARPVLRCVRIAENGGGALLCNHRPRARSCQPPFRQGPHQSCGMDGGRSLWYNNRKTAVIHPYQTCRRPLGRQAEKTAEHRFNRVLMGPRPTGALCARRTGTRRGGLKAMTAPEESKGFPMRQMRSGI